MPNNILYILFSIFFIICVIVFSYNIPVDAVKKEKVIIVEEPKVNQTVLMITKLNPKVDKDVVLIISNAIEKYSEKYSLSIPLIISLMFRESGFRPLIVSKSNCIGLMQINPKAHPKKVKPYKYDELYHINVNVNIGCQILREYLDKKKSIKGALESYLGVSNKGYMMDILSTCVELGIEN